MASFEDFGSGRTDVASSKFRSYKGKEGKTDRVGVVFTDKSKIYLGTKIHYKDKYFICKSSGTNKAVCCTSSYKGNKPKYRISAVLVVYQIGKDESGKAKLTGYELIPWVFSDTVYQKLSEIDNEFSLETHDLKLKCTNEGFQNIDITPCNDSIWRKNPELMKKILAEYPTVREDSKSNLGQDLSIEEIKELIGIETPGSEDAAADVAVGDVLDNL